MGDLVLAALSNLSETLPTVEDRSGTWTRADLRRGVANAHNYFSRNGIGVGHRVAIVTGVANQQFARLITYAGLQEAFAVFEARAAALNYLGGATT